MSFGCVPEGYQAAKWEDGSFERRQACCLTTTYFWKVVNIGEIEIFENSRHQLTVHTFTHLGSGSGIDTYGLYVGPWMLRQLHTPLSQPSEWRILLSVLQTGMRLQETTESLCQLKTNTNGSWDNLPVQHTPLNTLSPPDHRLEHVTWTLANHSIPFPSP